jgi:hypothetical protein
MSYRLDISQPFSGIGPIAGANPVSPNQNENAPAVRLGVLRLADYLDLK